MSGSNFFDFREKLMGKTPEPDAPATASAKQSPQPMSVSQLTSVIDRAIKAGVPTSVLVKGEVSNFNHHRQSGHLYFTLKDAHACIDCVMWRSDAARLKFQPEDGHELVARGRVDVYGARGKYQLYVSSLQPLGRGALEIAFRQLYEKLKNEGLFEQARKRPLPVYPLKIALVTSRDGAAVQDMLKVFARFGWLQLGLYPVPVQGDGAAETIAAAIKFISSYAHRTNIELVVLARGGGSIEDLWEFNEECVARAIVGCSVPVVTGIGHEVDTSIADLVADHHAHTPTEAAQVITARWRGAVELLVQSTNRLDRAMRTGLQDARHRLRAIHQHEFFRRPTDRTSALRQLLDDRQRALIVALSSRVRSTTNRVERLGSKLLERHPRHAVELERQKVDLFRQKLKFFSRQACERITLRLDGIQKQLHALAPARVLARGYSITRIKKGGVIVRHASQVKPGDQLITRVSDGEIESVADDSKQPRLFE